jgi:hypothetical protein
MMLKQRRQIGARVGYKPAATRPAPRQHHYISIKWVCPAGERPPEEDVAALTGDVSRGGGYAMCQHKPPCPSSRVPGRATARVVTCHPEQGWSLLCNGVVLFEDTGELLPDGEVIPPHRPVDLRPATPAPALVRCEIRQSW